MATAVLQVTALAGIGIEQRAQAIAGVSAGRRDNPGIAKKAVADAEVQPAGHRQVALGQRVGIVIVLLNTACTAAQGSVLQGIGSLCGLADRGNKQSRDGGDRHTEFIVEHKACITVRGTGTSEDQSCSTKAADRALNPARRFASSL